jgi:PAS domain S-box-containing protein
MDVAAPSTILIVEDDPGIAELERARLEDVGYRIVLASSAADAIATLRAAPVDLILLDYRLPGDVDGLDFFAQVRAAGFDLPVILVTGFSNEATVIRALRAGVRDFVTKSTEYLDYLPDAVGRVLRQVRTETRLAESEARLAGIISSAKDAILVADAAHCITLFNAAAERMFRCPAEDAIGQPVTRFIPPDVPEPRAGDSAAFTVRLRAGTRGIRADGETFPLEASVSRVREGRRKFYTIVVRDVTDRARAEARIREQAALLDQARDAILVRDLDDNILYWNRGAERLYGWTEAEAVGTSAGKLFARNDTPERAAAHRVVMEHGAWSGELQQVAKDGRPLVVESRRTLVRDAAGRPKSILIINTDITAKKKLETQLQHAQRLEAVGVLASGVAHDFNNLLTVINGYTEMLLAQTRPEAPAHAMLREIAKAGESATTLTQQLLAFGRKQVLSPRVVNLNALVAEAEKMLRRLIGADVELTTALDPALGSVMADPGQIQQVLMNLVVNARDAMANGGTITLTTRNATLNAATARAYVGAAAGPHVVLTVADTGCGIDEATKARIFEPFFTTKEIGKGTGLGLAMVHGIVTQSGGHIDVETAPGRGARFQIYLPRIDAAAADRGGDSATGAQGGSETVLLVEDEARVRELGHLALQSVGYTVLEAPDGEQALRLVARHPGPIHLLVTDVVMPRMNGRALADHLTRARPNVKVLYISGYADEALSRYGVPTAGAAFLQKPFTPGVLARTVRDLLGR